MKKTLGILLVAITLAAALGLAFEIGRFTGSFDAYQDVNELLDTSMYFESAVILTPEYMNPFYIPEEKNAVAKTE